MSAGELQALLRFLSQDAKVPLATAMSKVKDLQKASLDSPEKLAKVKHTDIAVLFTDEKVAKQIISAAKRVSKKRAAGDDAALSPAKKKRHDFSAGPPSGPLDLEASIALPVSTASEEELSNAVVHSNRAPLVLAFTVTLLKHTMPEQPLSSRLSLAQAYVSTTSRSRAVSLGIQTLDKAEIEAEERLAEGQPSVSIMGKGLRVLRRWGYEWNQPAEGEPKSKSQTDETDDEPDTQDQSNRPPALWALDLEALRKSNRSDIASANIAAGNHSKLPIYTPQSARAYLLKSFDSVDPSGKKPSAAARVERKASNLGHLLRTIELLYDSWAKVLEPEELEKRTWGWYVKVRPAVEDGVAGWGGKNEIKLSDILALRKQQ
ncbi:hypothetical protein BAUCODRAFT_76812 [Baudoinia panamericana UAMH 10762]|uniref:Impact N-terminal domain-containing protein n=1 Tax=Baudoinia panamericana (strain UAMH 10762) TaxID=717646 RepID=M2LG83_BAUPA|nr:uncharacterized protein BAUCODRAFT_76812 [Baudoinia panamericana UAMH 10762]EMC93047.1 hypothetical protein BAUCODRAFT_76812 [Baudoinia panamericana UAMH 10762]